MTRFDGFIVGWLARRRWIDEEKRKMTATRTARQMFVVAIAMMLTLTLGPRVVLAQHSSGDQTSAAGKEESGAGLEGVWQTVVTFVDCQTGEAFGSIQALRTIARGGTLSETGPSFPGLGHGIWQQTSKRQFSVAFAYYAYGPEGEFAGNANIKEYITLGRNLNSYTSTSTFQFFEPTGEVSDSGCSTETATRFTF